MGTAEAAESTASDKLTDEAEAGRRSDVLAARLALLGFLAAGFWLSRTYVPVLYVLLALPIAALLAMPRGAMQGNGVFKRTPGEMMSDACRVAALSLGSIFAIWLMASRLK